MDKSREHTRIGDCRTYADAVRSSADSVTSRRRKRGKRGNGIQRRATRKKRAEHRHNGGTDAATEQRGTHNHGDARSSRRDNDSDLCSLLKQQNRMLGQLVATMQNMQRAMTVMSLATTTKPQKKQPERESRSGRGGSKGGKGGRGTLHTHPQKPTWKQEKLELEARQLKHRQRRDYASQVVRVTLKLRDIMKENSFQARLQNLKLQIIQNWIHNAPKCMQARLSRVRIHDCIVAAAEHAWQ